MRFLAQQGICPSMGNQNLLCYWKWMFLSRKPLQKLYMKFIPKRDDWIFLSTMETPVAEIHHAFETNVYGPIRVAQTVVPKMREQGSGLIVNITSIAGFMGLPFRGIYSASKGALEVAMEALRMEVKGFGIKVSCLAPGDFATNIAAGRYHVPATPSSPYPAYQRTLEMINEDVDKASNPILVAEKVYKIIQKTHPKVHYAVGDFMQKMSLRLKRLLPDKIFEKLLLNHYKL